MLIEWSSDNYFDNPFESWRYDIMQDSTPFAVGIEPTGLFSASHKILDINGLQLGQNTISSANGRRTKREINDSTVDKYTCVVMTKGSQGVSQGLFNHRAIPGQIYLWDSELPCCFDISETTSQLEIGIPKDRVHQLTGGKTLSPNLIDGTTGIGAVLNQFMNTAFDNAVDFSTHENDMVSEMFVQLVVSNFTGSHNEKVVNPKKRNLDRLYRYINANLFDSELSPVTVSKANGISVRYLHLLFAQTPYTFSMYLNEQRIAKVKSELQNRSVSEVTLTELAFHCGFNSSAQFSRVFKRVSGQTPRSYRKKLSNKLTHPASETITT